MEDTVAVAASGVAPNWRRLYEAALSELNPADRRKKIDLANGAIHERLYRLADEQGQGGEEQKAIVDALQTMRGLQELTSTLPSDILALQPVVRDGVS